MKSRIIGVYQIYCSISKEIYVGSSINIKDRWYRHKKDLRKNKSHSIILQRAWNKYGEENFEFSIIEECEQESLLRREQYYLETLKPVYNICPSAFSTAGRKEREETKELRRQINKRLGIKPPESTWKERQKSIIMLDDNKEEIETFPSLAAACRAIGRDSTFVSCLTRATILGSKSYGFYWKFNKEI